MTAELVRRGRGEIDFVVVSHILDEELRPLVEWRRVRAPAGPPKAFLPFFFTLGGLQVRRSRADLVHVHSGGPLVPNRVDLNSVHFCRAAFFRALGDEIGAVTRLHLWLERWCARRSRRLAVLSPGGRRDAELFFAGVPIVEIPNGVDAETFRPDSAARNEVRAEESALEEHVVALFVGNSFRRKGLHVAIEALGLAAASGDTALRLWVAGHGDKDRYGALAREHGVGDRVRFLGLRGDAERLYAAADIFVLPTLYEQFCLTAWEAAAAKLPLIVTTTSGMDELVGDGGAGIAVERDPQQVSDALLRLAAAPALRSSMGETGRRRALRYTWERSIQRTLMVYRELLAERS